MSENINDFLAQSLKELDGETIDEVQNEKTEVDKAIEQSGSEFESASEDVIDQKTIEAAAEKEVETEIETEKEVADEVVEFNPTFGYKIKDEEREIPEEFRDFIKDQETQDRFIDLFTRADGLETVKESRQKLQEQFDSQVEKYNTLNKAMGVFENMSSTKDVKGLLDAASFSTEDVLNSLDEETKLKHVMELLKRQESPEAQREYERARAVEQENLKLKSQLNTQTIQADNSKMEAEKLEFETTMAKPEVQKWQGELDGRAGDGEFIRAVAEVGMAYFAQHGEDMTMEAAVNIVKNRYGLGQPAVEPAPAKKEVPTRIVKKVATTSSMPDLESTGDSPVDRGINSIEDIIAERDRHFKLKKG